MYAFFSFSDYDGDEGDKENFAEEEETSLPDDFAEVRTFSHHFLLPFFCARISRPEL